MLNVLTVAAHTRLELEDARDGIIENHTMIKFNLRLLQLNMMESRAGMEALIND